MSEPRLTSGLRLGHVPLPFPFVYPAYIFAVNASLRLIPFTYGLQFCPRNYRFHCSQKLFSSALPCMPLESSLVGKFALSHRSLSCFVNFTQPRHASQTCAESLLSTIYVHVLSAIRDLDFRI